MPIPEVDPTIILKGGVAPPDILGTVSKATALGQGLLQNRLLQQEVAGKIARGRAAQSAIDQKTGRFDPDAFMRNLSASPDGAQSAPEAATLAQQQRLAQVQQVTAEAESKRQQLGLTVDQGKAIGASMLPFYQQFSTPDPKTGAAPVPTAEDFAHALTTALVNMGPAADENVINRAAALLDHIQKDPSPQNLLHMAASTALMGNPTPETVGMIYGTPAPIDTGDATVMARTPTLTGQTSTGAVIPKNLPPGEAVSPAYQRFNPVTQQMETVLKGDALAAQRGGGGGQGAIPSAPPLGATEAASVFGTKTGEQAVALQTLAESVPVRKAMLGNLEGLVGNFTPGPGSDWTKAAKAFANNVSPFGAVFDPSKIASQEEFTKQAGQLAQEQFKSLGGTGTDNQLASTMHTSPNAALSKMGNLGIIRMLKGNEDAISAKNAAWQAWLSSGKNPSSYGQFTQQFNQLWDPRVFQSAYMTPTERKTMISGMSEAEKAKFATIYNNAIKLGWIPNPNGK